MKNHYPGNIESDTKPWLQYGKYLKGVHKDRRGVHLLIWIFRRQYYTTYCNWICGDIRDSGGSNVTRRRPYHERLDICKQVRSKITESREFPEELTFSYETAFHIIGKVNRQKLPNLKVGETSRNLTTWKRLSIIKCLVRDQEITHYQTFLFWRRKSGCRVIPYNAARFPHSWISTVKSYRQKLFFFQQDGAPCHLASN